jgi:hypothetical protein
MKHASKFMIALWLLTEKRSCFKLNPRREWGKVQRLFATFNNAYGRKPKDNVQFFIRKLVHKGKESKETNYENIGLK